MMCMLPRRRRRDASASSPARAARICALVVVLLALGACKRDAPPPTAAPPTAAPPTSAPLPRTASPTAAGSPTDGAAAPPSGGLLALPHVTLVALSDWSAVIQPCGCTEELQRGGIERIAFWLGAQGRVDPGLALVHAGSLLVEAEPPRPDEVAQRTQRQQLFVSLLHGLPVAAVAVSSVDLRDGGAKVRELLGAAGLPLLAVGWDPGLAGVQPHRVVERAGVKVGLFALDPAAGELATQQELAAAQVQALRSAGAELVVVLSNLGLRNSRRLARSVQGLDAVVIGAVPERFEPVEEADREGAAWLLEAPGHGAAMAVLTLARNGAADPPPDPDAEGAGRVDASAWLPGAVEELQARIQRIEADLATMRGREQSVATQLAMPFWTKQLDDLRARLARARSLAGQPLPKGLLGAYRSVALPWSEPVDPAVAARVRAFTEEIGKRNEEALKDPLPAVEGKARYLGQQVCLGCHAATQGFATSNPHSHAWPTLQAAGKTRDLDCVGCHTTGWRQPGGSAFGNVATFANVQCEACHGPGSLHVAAADKSAPITGFERTPGEAVCAGCHTPEHAPRFDFGLYRRKLVVPGHGAPLQPATP